CMVAHGRRTTGLSRRWDGLLDTKFPWRMQEASRSEMSEVKRRRFLSTQDWFNFLNDVRSGVEPPDTPLADLRQPVYREIEALRKRPLFIYAVRFTDKQSGPISIDLGDVDGFTDLVNAA